MKSRNILIAALIMALVTTLLFRQYLKELDKKYKEAQKKISIVVANQDISKNQRVTKEMLEFKEFSADSVHPQAVKKMEDIVGNYALTDIKAGEVLFDSRFTNEFKEEDEITRKIRDGYRAVSIEVNYVESVSNLIEPEDYVDVILNLKETQPGSDDPIKTETLLENVRVLAVGKQIVEKSAANNAKAEDSSNSGSGDTSQGTYNAVTLELNPEDTQKLINSDERGNIKLVLRSKAAPK